MKLTQREINMVKLAAAQIAVNRSMKKQASFQEKLASYGIGLCKQAETYGQAISRQVDKGLDSFGNWLDKSWKTVQMNAGKTPNQVNPPSDAEYQKGYEIYGRNLKGPFMTRVSGSPLWEETARDRKMNRRLQKEDAIFNARLAARAAKERFQRQKSNFQLNMDLARGASTPERRDDYLREARLLPPRDDFEATYLNIFNR